MSVPLTRRTTDHSDSESFSFSFYCDTCGREWRSPKEMFRSGGLTAIEHEDARRMIWAQEHKAAFEEANLEAHFHFNHCQDNSGWVCDECFAQF